MRTVQRPGELLYDCFPITILDCQQQSALGASKSSHYDMFGLGDSGIVIHARAGKDKGNST